MSIQFAGKKSVLLLVMVSISLMFNSIAFGHAKNETYIWVNPQQDHFDGQIQFRLDDLRKYLEMEIPTEYQAAREALVPHQAELAAYVKERFQMRTVEGEEIPYEIERIDLMESDFFGHFVQLFFKTPTMVVPSKIVIESTFLFDQNTYTRCLLCSQYNHFTGESYPERFFYAILSPWDFERQVDFLDLQPIKAGRRYYVWEGIRHIWIGLDHILFLITLLLASVLVKRRVDDKDSQPVEDDSAGDHSSEPAAETVKPRFQWVPVEGFRGAFWSIFKIVTIFTIAHSITLALASLDIISLPSRLVESIIALSIVLVAINNIIPKFRDRTWVILFLFGLFHGMGFASVMKNLPFRMPDLPQLLVCFNIGVELGQLAIVIAIFPIIFFLRKSPWYNPVILYGGSLIMILIAGYWFIERALGWA